MLLHWFLMHIQMQISFIVKNYFYRSMNLVIVISNRFRSAVTDIRALRGPNTGSFHNLMKINIKVKLRVKTGNKYDERKMVNIFQNPKWKQEHATEINNIFEILENLNDEDSIDNYINEKWENIKTIIRETKQ